MFRLEEVNDESRKLDPAIHNLDRKYDYDFFLPDSPKLQRIQLLV